MQHLSAGAFGDFESMKNTSRVLAECSVDDDLDEKAEMRRLGVLIFEATWCRTLTSGGLKGDC
jgi:hypothetical protein